MRSDRSFPPASCFCRLPLIVSPMGDSGLAGDVTGRIPASFRSSIRVCVVHEGTRAHGICLISWDMFTIGSCVGHEVMMTTRGYRLSPVCLFGLAILAHQLGLNLRFALLSQRVFERV
jgi:hypothetical protein